MVDLPEGFQTYSHILNQEIQKKEKLGIIYSEAPANYAGVFTSNRVFAAPVRLCRARLGQKIQVVVINSGNANACTGEEGYQNALSICESAEKLFHTAKGSALSLSTGVIGIPLPIRDILSRIKGTDSYDKTPESFAHAIMTTDTCPKIISRKVQIQDKIVTVTGFAKGAGMIAPNLATMLAFILTDVSLNYESMQKILIENVEDTFNSITIDGDMSTNDSIIFLANGKSQVKIDNDKNLKTFKGLVFEIMEYLAKKVVEDGEGKTKLIEIIIEKAATKKDAVKIGLSIANSLLVKTALFGNDPNWGRILAAAGYSGVDVDEKKMELYFFDRWLYKGKPLQFNKSDLISKLKKSQEIKLKLILNQGNIRKKFYTTDLSYDYIKINSEYST